MKTYTIENETNNITVHASAKDAKAAPNSQLFSKEIELAKLASDWPATRLVEIWNGVPGVVPVKKFTNRKTAVSRLWTVIQNLGASVMAESASEESVSQSPEPTTPTPVAPETAHVASAEAPARNKATRAKKAPKPATQRNAAREGSKTETILALMRQPGGVTLNAIMEATGWQAHSVRGFVSGTLGKKMGFTVKSVKAEGGERTYSISA